MINGPVFVTPHAVRKFIERIAPLTYEAARDAILAGITEAVRAGRVKPLVAGGIGVRARGRYSFRAVIVPGEGRLPAVATILRSGH